MRNGHKLKIVLVGDDSAEKAKFLTSYAVGAYPSEDPETYIDHTVFVMLDGRPIELHLEYFPIQE